jgi:hypothetical protein
MGGLGNQFFQYALGRRLSLERQVPLKLDISWFATQSKRTYQLNHYKINAELTEPKEIQDITHSTQLDLFSHFFCLFQRFLPNYHRRLINENGSGFDPNILRASNNVCLVGYWQSEKYFKQIEYIIHDELRLREELHPINASIMKQIRTCRAVSLHVRRGDYLEPNYLHYFYHCDPGYYRKAMDLILHNFPDVHFFIFSEDLEWAKHNITTETNISYVENNQLDRDWETVYLMSQCQHHIIANSSFSWWGAWLNQNPDKIVIAPEIWLTSHKLSGVDRIPEKWIQI